MINNDKWLAFNDPMWTDVEPYCNRISYITEADAVACMKRMRPLAIDIYEADPTKALSDFSTVHFAWRSNPPDVRRRDEP